MEERRERGRGEEGEYVGLFVLSGPFVPISIVSFSLF